MPPLYSPLSLEYLPPERTIERLNFASLSTVVPSVAFFCSCSCLLLLDELSNF